MPSHTNILALDRNRIEQALAELNRRLADRGITAEVCLFGGAAMILAFQSRQTTKDIDAMFVPANEVREIVRAMGREMNYGDGWFNDGVKGFISDNPEHTAAGLPQFDHLRVMMPVPGYLLAMKCMAARLPTADASDVADVKFLINKLGLRTPQQVMEIVTAYFPSDRIQPKTQYFIETVLEEVAGNG